MKAVKPFLITLVVFAAGFYTHSFVTDTPLLPPKISSSQYAKLVLGTSNAPGKYNFHNRVIYDGNQFKPSFIMMVKDSFIDITNQSKDKGMWLVSDNPLLSTPRAYLESEQLENQLSQLGQYTVVNKENPGAVLTVKVVSDY